MFQALAAIALLAIAAHALIPTGYMLATDRLVTAVVMCSGYGPVNAVIDLRTGKISTEDEGGAPARNGDQRDDAGAPCAFAALASPAIVGATLGVRLPSVVTDVRFALAFPTVIAATSLLTPWSTGPPLAH